MSESDFEFEADDGEVFDEDYGIGNYNGDGNEGLALENAYYEAEDAVTHDPQRAVTLLSALKDSIEQKLQDGSGVPTATLHAWRMKVYGHSLKMPSTSIQDKLSCFDKILESITHVSSVDAGQYIPDLLDSIENRNGVDVVSPDTMLSLYLKATTSARQIRAKRVWTLAAQRLLVFLLKRHDYKEAEHWIAKLYLTWMADTAQTQGPQWEPPEEHTPAPWESEDFFLLIDNSPSEDARLLELLALDMEICKQLRRVARQRRLIQRCLKMNRALLDKRTFALLRENVAEYFFTRANYDTARLAYYDAWESSYALGNFEQARHCLVLTILSNYMCQSEIDATTTSEAQTLLHSTSPGAQGLRLQVDFLNEISRLTKLGDIRQLKQCLENRAAPGNVLGENAVCAASTAADDLLRRIRINRLREDVKQYTRIRFGYLQRQLAFESRYELFGFLVSWIAQYEGKEKVTINGSFPSLEITQPDLAKESLENFLGACQDFTRAMQPCTYEIL